MAVLACGKREEGGPSLPSLAFPERTFPSVGQTATRENVEAQAEVKASSGPVQLILRVYKTKIKTMDFLGNMNSLWYQIELKNTSKKSIGINDKVFHEPWALADKSYSTRNIGIWLDVQGPDGKRPPRRPVMSDVDTTDMLAMPHPDTKEGTDIRARLKDKSPLEQSIFLSGYFQDQDAQYRKEHPEPDTSFWIEPGASTTTPAWALQDNPGRLIETRPVRQPAGRFAELYFLYMKQPGKYRIRAVYDHQWSGPMPEYGDLKPEPEEVMVKTPYITFEVLP